MFVDQKKLFNAIAQSASQPRFALHLGAGASVSSKVKSTQEMIAMMRSQYQRIESISDYDKLRDDSGFDWIDTYREYAVLMDKVFETTNARRDFIEECVKSSIPYWGYLYLSNLVKSEHFNLIFTTNFDDLISRSFVNFCNLYPVVISEDSTLEDYAWNVSRPTIIKLHGDYLYRSISNTQAETERLKKNMLGTFQNTFRTHLGLIVIGYGGNDKSVMDAIKETLKDKNSFQYGIYWCLQEPYGESELLKELIKIDEDVMGSEHLRIRRVKIRDFDIFLSEMHHYLGLELPKVVLDPYGNYSSAMSHLLECDKNKHNEKIANDADSLKKTINAIVKMEQINIQNFQGFELVSEKFTIRMPIPFGDIARILFSHKHYNDAREFAIIEFNMKKNYLILTFLIYKKLLLNLDDDKINEMIKTMFRDTKEIEKLNVRLMNVVLAFIYTNRFFDARTLLDKIKHSYFKLEAREQSEWHAASIEVNIAQTYLHNNETIPECTRQNLEKFEDISDIFANLSVKIALSKFDEATALVRQIMNWQTIPVQQFQWPIFRLLASSTNDLAVKQFLEQKQVPIELIEFT